MATSKESGIVKFYNKNKGFGFITFDNGEIFVHASGLKDRENELKEGDKVEFDIANGKKGLNATNVIVI